MRTIGLLGIVFLSVLICKVFWAAVYSLFAYFFSSAVSIGLTAAVAFSGSAFLTRIGS